MAGMQSLTDLPDSCLLDVLKSCEGVDLLKFQMASRRLCGLAKAPVIWRDVLMREFELPLPKLCPYSWMQRIFRSMQESKGSALGYINYWGMLTDGGLDDNSPFYWVDNMFSGKADYYYCSQTYQSSDIRCIALQDSYPSRPCREENIKAVKTTADNNRANNKTRYLGSHNGLDTTLVGPTSLADDQASNHDLLVDEESLQLLYNKSCSSGQDIVINRGVRIGRLGGLTCPVSSGVVLLGNYDLSTAPGSSTDLSRQLYAQSYSQQSNQFNKLIDLESVLSACCNKELDLPLVVCFGNSGEWAEFESGPGKSLTGESLRTGNDNNASSSQLREQNAHKMRPAVWFRFYRKGEEIKNSSRREYLSAEFSALGVICKRVTEKVQPSSYDHMAVDEDEYLLHDTFGPELSDSSSESSSSSSDSFDSVHTAPSEGPSAGPSTPPHVDIDVDVDGDLLQMAHANAISSSDSLPSTSLTSVSSWDEWGPSDEHHTTSGFGDAAPGTSRNSPLQPFSQAEILAPSTPDATSTGALYQAHNPAHVVLPGVQASGSTDSSSGSEEDIDVDSVLFDAPGFEWVDYSDFQSTVSDESERHQFWIGTPEGLHTYWSTRSMHDREMMDIVFEKPVVGNALCVMLNNCENLMDDMHDMHEGPNVDVNFVWMMGQTVAVGNVDSTCL